MALFSRLVGLRLRGAVWIVVLVAAAGIALSIWWPIWVAPPNVMQTLLIYLAVAYLWLPTLLIVAVVRRVRATVGGLFITLALAAVEFYLFSYWTAPNVSVATQAWLTSNRCTTTLLADNQIEYACRPATVDSLPFTFKMVGQQGSPFVRLTERSR